MYDMSVTLEVSKLSGWSNALAYCRVERGGRGESGVACGAQRGARASGGGGGGRKPRVQGGAIAAEGRWPGGHARSARKTWSPCP